MTEASARIAEVAVPSLPFTEEDLVILSGVDKEFVSNVYGLITTMDYQVIEATQWQAFTSEIVIHGSCDYASGSLNEFSHWSHHHPIVQNTLLYF